MASSGVAALGANLLKLKPALEMKDGKLGVYKKYRGNINSVYRQYITEAVELIGRCGSCRDFSQEALCPLCLATGRERSQLCVVESPADRLAIEQATGFRGLYYVLLGRLSPLDGIGPLELGLELLGQRLAAGEVNELIIATSATVEGEATAHYLAQLARRHGVRPVRRECPGRRTAT